MFVYIPTREYFLGDRTIPAFPRTTFFSLLVWKQMDLWLFPTANAVLNTFLRSIVLIAILVLGLQTSWYTAYWGAVIHDAISLVLIRSYV
jgi:hypothetical protein